MLAFRGPRPMGAPGLCLGPSKPHHGQGVTVRRSGGQAWLAASLAGWQPARAARLTGRLCAICGEPFVSFNSYPFQIFAMICKD